MEDLEKKQVLEIDTTKAQKSLKELREELKKYKDEMTNVDEGSEQFLKLANAAGEVKHQIDEINQSVRGASADFGDLMSSATKSANGIMGAFQAVRGTITLLGVESDNVEKAIQKMQASMAVIQGVQAIDEGVKGFKKLATAIKVATGATSGFKAALISTGIGTVVVLLGELIAHWDDVTAAMRRWGIMAEDSKKKQEELNKAQKEHLENLHQLQNDYDEWVKKIAALEDMISESIGEIITENEMKDTKGHLNSKMLRNTLDEILDAMLTDTTLDFHSIKQSFNDNLTQTLMGMDELGYRPSRCEEKVAVEMVHAAAKKCKDNVRKTVNDIVSGLHQDVEGALRDARENSIDVFINRKDDFINGISNAMNEDIEQLEKDLQNKTQKLALLKNVFNELKKIDL